MKYDNEQGCFLDTVLLENYFEKLTNRFFKILPLKEEEEATLPTYIESLQLELLGCKGFIPDMYNNSSLATLLFTLQYLLDNPSCDTKVVKREVFRSISICNKLKNSYRGG